jgi:uncharacterized membrane protein
MNDTNLSRGPDEPIFSALLTPHRSLGRTGIIIVMAIFASSMMVPAIVFLSLGAWPIFGFLGLDFVGVAVAFWLNSRQARAHERVSVSRTRLDIDQVAPSGKSLHHQFNPFRAKFAVSRHSEIGITAMQVLGEGRAVRIGSFLNPDDRESFASAFGHALAIAKR